MTPTPVDTGDGGSSGGQWSIALLLIFFLYGIVDRTEKIQLKRDIEALKAQAAERESTKK